MGGAAAPRCPYLRLRLCLEDLSNLWMLPCLLQTRSGTEALCRRRLCCWFDSASQEECQNDPAQGNHDATAVNWTPLAVDLHMWPTTDALT